MQPISVFLCDDVREFRMLVRFALEEDPAIRVVGEAGDGEAGVEGVARLQPDVVLLDLSMPRLDGLEAIPRIHRVAPRTKIIALSGFGSERMASTVLDAGAHQYLEKGVPVERILVAVRATA